MNTKIPPRPDSPGARGTYAFHSAWYWLVVKKVEVTPTPGPRRDGRDLKIVFEVYRPDADGRPVRCEEERLAQHVALSHKGGAWRTCDPDDIDLLNELGIPGGSPVDDDATARLKDRWIAGRPAPPGVDGYNALAVFGPLPTPPGGVRLGPDADARPFGGAEATAPPRPRPAATTDRPMPMGSLSNAELPHCSPTQAVASKSPPSPGTSQAYPHPEQMRETLMGCLSDFFGGTSDRKSTLAPRAAQAYSSFQRAEQHLGEGVTDKEAYRWLMDHDHGDYDLPDKFDSWARYLREARKALGTSKHIRRDRPPESRSLVDPRGILVGTDGKRIVRKKNIP